MKIAYNPLGSGALPKAPDNKDITFDLAGKVIYALGVPFDGKDTKYTVFKKHTSSDNKGGSEGLVPIPSYSTTNNRLLREDGLWINVTGITPPDAELSTESTNAVQNKVITNKINEILTSIQLKAADIYKNVKVGNTTLVASGINDTLEFTLGNGITITPNATNKTLEFSINATGNLGISTSYNNKQLVVKILDEYYNKWNAVYDWYISVTKEDTDNLINKWLEIVDFLNSIAEGTDILDEFVTRKTDLTIIGGKTFSKQIISSVAQGTAPFSVASTTVVSKLNADLLDGVHASGLFTNLSNDTNLLSVTIGGTNKKLTIDYANATGRLEGGSIATWGTLTSANGYTNVATYDYGGTKGAFSFAGKGGQLSLQLDGFFYQNEGRFLVLDTNNYSTHLDNRYYTETEINNKLKEYLPLLGGQMLGSITMPYSTYIYGVNESGGGMLFFDGTRTILGSIGTASTASTHIRSKNATITVGTGNSGDHVVLHSGNYSGYLDNRYYTETEANDRFVNITGDTMTGPLNFANGTWNSVGDDAAIGDYNAAGMLGLKSLNNDIPGVGFHNKSGTLLGRLQAKGNNLYWNDNLIIHGGNNNLGYIGTTAVQSSSAAQALTGITNATISNNINLGGELVWSKNTDYAKIYFKNSSNGDTDSYMDLQTGDNGNEYIKFSRNSGGTISTMATIKSEGIRTYGYFISELNSRYVKIGPQNSSHAHYETNADVSHWFNKRVDVNGAIWRYGTDYGIESDGKFYAHTVYANRSGSYTAGGVSLYSNSDPMTYGIAFRGTGTYGTHGGVSGDWATYLTMSDTTNRGWIFRRGSSNVFSISGTGYISSNNSGYFAGNLSSANSGASSPGDAALEVREYARAGTNTSTAPHSLLYAPRVGFHWGNRYWGNIIYYDSTFRFMNHNASSYAPIQASTITGGTGNFTNLTVINDSSNTGYDALAYFRHYNNNDWAVIIDKTNSYSYGLDIRCGGEYALKVGAGKTKLIGATTIGADATPSYTLDVRGTLRATSRIYANEWIEFSGGAGLYWPNNYGSHFYINGTSSYGLFMLLGSKNGYSGIHFGNSVNYLTIMSTDLHHGLYCDNFGWEFYFRRDNGYVGLRTSSIPYPISMNGDSYTTGWSRAANGFYVENTGVHYTSLGSVGAIQMTSNNEFIWGSSNGTLYFNYRATSRGSTVSHYIWNAGSSSSYANHTVGKVLAQSTPSSWLDGQRYERGGFNLMNATDTGSYWPWFRQTLTAASKWISVGTLGNSLYFIGSATSRTANSYDYGFRMDFSNGYLYGNFSGYLSGTASYASNADAVDGQHFNWNNNKNDHTYLWAASSSGLAYLVHRASMSVNYATYARYVYCTSGSYLNFQWSGQGGLPTWLFGSNDGANVYVWNPSNFSVNYANSAGNSDKLDGYHAGDFLRYEGWWNSGSGQNVNNALGMVFAYGDHGAPGGWGITTTFECARNSSYRFQMHADGYNNRVYFRNRSADRGGWLGWLLIATTNMIPSVGNGTVTIKQAGTTKGSFTMNQSGNTTIELTDNNTTYSFAAKGSTTRGIYLSGTNTFTTMLYSLAANVNSGTTSKLAYYSGANAISAYSSTVGSSVLPIYMNAGVPTACSVPMVRYWAIYSINNLTYTKQAGNISPITSIARMLNNNSGAYCVYCSFPTGYSFNTTMIWGAGSHESTTSTPSEKGTLYVSVTAGANSYFYVRTSNDSTTDNGQYRLFFLCIG